MRKTEEFLLDKERTWCRHWSQRTAEGNQCPRNSFMTFQDTVSLREQVCVSSTKEIPSWIHNPPSPGLNDYPSATAQTDSPIPNLKQKSTHSKFVQCISEKRCSQTPLPAPHAFGIVTNSVTAWKSMKLDRWKSGGWTEFTCILFTKQKLLL